MNNLEQARNLYSRQKYKEARRLFDQEYNSSQAIEALYGSALCDYELNDFQNSIKKLNQILTTHPNNHLVYNQIGMIAFKVGDKKTAETMFEKVIELKPDFEDGYLNLLEIMQDNSGYKKYSLLRRLSDTFPANEIYCQEAIDYIDKYDIAKSDISILVERLKSISPNHTLVKKYINEIGRPKELIIEKTQRPLNILFLQNTPCIRNYKYAQALKARGHKVTLAYTDNLLSQRYTGLSDDVYEKSIKISDYRYLWDISENFDLIHSHNEPDTLTVAAFAAQCPVIHDTHDLISLRDIENPSTKYFEGIANRGAAGRIYTTPYQQAEAKFLYGVKGPSLVYYNYASAADIPDKLLGKKSEKDGNIHIVYEGGISTTKHRNFIDIFTGIAQLDKSIHIHIYPARWDIQIEKIFHDFKNIHYYHPVSPKQIIREMSQYDYGIIPWNLNIGQKRFLDSTIANKLFEYLAAGLPVFTSDVHSYVDYFKDNPVGMIFTSAEDLVTKIPELKQKVKDIDLNKYVFTYESEIRRLERYYYEIIDQRQKNSQPINRLFNISSYPVINTTSHRELLDLDKSQWLDKEKIEAIQNYFLKKLVVEVYENVPYYKKAFDKAGIDPYKVRNIGDLSTLPIINKDIIQKNYDLFINPNLHPKEKIPTGTGGSTGKTLRYFITPEVDYYGIGCRNRGFSWAGFNPDKDKVVFFAGGSLGVTNKVEIKDNKLLLPTTGITNKEVLFRYYEAMKSFNAKYMRAYPSALYIYCEFLRDNHLSLKFDAVVCTAEMLFDYQREYIEETLDCKVFNEYGAYDGGAGAFECEKHNLHLQAERGIIEILDDNNQPVQSDESGRIISTDLHNYAFPLIRYDVGDRATLSNMKCSCGRGLPIVERLEGRSSDYILLTDGTRQSGETVIHIFNKLLHTNVVDITEYQVLQRKDYSLEVKVIPGSHYNTETRNIILSSLKEHYPGLNIAIDEVEEIPLLPSGKRRFVYSEIESSHINKTVAKKTKICHIGGAHSIHISELVEELDKLGYDQCIISYMPVEKSITPRHIPVYYYNYRNYPNSPSELSIYAKSIESFLATVFTMEKPDIVNGHSSLYSALAATIAKIKFNLPMVIIPWSTHNIKNGNKSTQTIENQALVNSDRILVGSKEIFNYYKTYYKEIKDEQFVLFRPLLPLELYHRSRIVCDIPRILSIRVMGNLYRQDLLIQVLSDLIKADSRTRATFLIGQHPDQGRDYYNRMVELAKKLNVFEHCKFIDSSLSKEEFAEQIYSHNIIYSIAEHDDGYAGSTTMAMYSGAITISQYAEATKNELQHDVHLLKVKVTEDDIRDKLIYVINNMEKLQKRFIKNNQFLSKFSKTKMIENLTNVYSSLMNNRM
jgi:phenylacetate-coenzyme A ligase PaaK-like adenylate-forming protein/glycosyltransferase involved in cell wall biosynthesis